VNVHGVPRYLRSDNGSEFVACAILRWLHEAGIETALIDPGKPWQNGADESFNGKLRDEYLSLQWFRNRVDARVGIKRWRQHYNAVRPHSKLEHLTPLEFKTTLRATTSPGAHRLRRSLTRRTTGRRIDNRRPSPVIVVRRTQSRQIERRALSIAIGRPETFGVVLEQADGLTTLQRSSPGAREPLIGQPANGDEISRCRHADSPWS
jgi:Integrase core domain